MQANEIDAVIDFANLSSLALEKAAKLSDQVDAEKAASADKMVKVAEAFIAGKLVDAEKKDALLTKLSTHSGTLEFLAQVGEWLQESETEKSAQAEELKTFRTKLGHAAGETRSTVFSDSPGSQRQSDVDWNTRMGIGAR